MVKKKNGLLALTLICFFLISLVFIASCGKSEKIKKIEAQKEIKIGAILPLTGRASAIGQWQKKGIDLAVDEINESGEILGRKFQVIYEDSILEPKTAVVVANKLISIQKLPAIFLTGSAVANAVLPIADKNNINLLLIAVSFPGIADRSPWAFRFNLGGDDETDKMADFLIQKLNIRNVAVLYFNDDFGDVASKNFKEKFEKNGGKIVYTDLFENSTSDFKSILSKIKPLKPEGIYVLGYTKPAALAMKQIREFGIKAYIFANMALTIPNLRKVASEGAEGAYYTTCLFDPSSSDPSIVKFVRDYTSKYNEPPSFFSAFSYDATKCLALSIALEGYSPEKIQKGLLNISNFSGVMGKTTILKNGDVKYPVRIVTLKGEKFIEVF